MDCPAINLGSFCSGVGLLDLAAKLAFEYHGIRTRSVFVAEWDGFAAEVLRSRMEDESLESAPIWCGDLREFPAKDFHGVVDAAVFGFPCQDISCAGRGAGIHGKRSGLFFDILASVLAMGCRILLMENVAALTVRGLDTVLGALAEAGFAAEWLCLQAAQVGASHKRERWFCVADSSERGQRELRQPPGSDGQPDGVGISLGDTASKRCGEAGDAEPERRTANVLGDDGTDVVNAESRRKRRISDIARRMESEPRSCDSYGSDATVGLASEDVEHTRGAQWAETNGRQEHAKLEPATASGRLADASGAGLSQRQGERRNDGGERATIERDCLPIFAPGPSDFDGWNRVVEDGSYDFRAPAIKPGLRVLADGISLVVDASRADQLRCAGNACVVLQGAVAFAKLLGRIIKQ